MNWNNNVKRNFKNVKVQLVSFAELEQDRDAHLILEQFKNISKLHDIVFAKNGTVYVNADRETGVIIADILSILASESMKELSQNYIMLRKKYPYLNTANLEFSLLKEPNDNEKVQMLYFMLIPAEIKRRSLERAYYVE